MTDLADTSAWVWSRRADEKTREAFDAAVVDGEVATCDMVRLELLYSARNADLLIAAAAEASDATVLHYDEDYDRIAEVTGQPTRWLAPRGRLG